MTITLPAGLTESTQEERCASIMKGSRCLTEKSTADSMDAAYPFYLVYTGKPEGNK